MKGTGTSIKNSVMGKALSNMLNPFIIVRQNVTLPYTKVSFKEWTLITTPDDTSGGYPLDQQTAESILNANNMILAHSDSDGEIYEMPGTPFKTGFSRI